MKIIRQVFRTGHQYWFYCPGCKCAHSYLVGCGIEKQNWTFKREATTFLPSLRVYYTHPETKQEITTCHLFVKNGNIEFCDDCPHEFKNQIVGLPEFPVNYGLPEPYEIVL